MIKRVCIILMMMGCIGCFNREIVKVPVSIPCPEPPVIIEPLLPEVKFIASNDLDAMVCLNEQNARNLLEDMLKLNAYIKELETALGAYKK